MYDREPVEFPEAAWIATETVYRAAAEQPEEIWRQDPDGNWHLAVVPVNVAKIAAEEYVRFKGMQYFIMTLFFGWVATWFPLVLLWEWAFGQEMPDVLLKALGWGAIPLWLFLGFWWKTKGRAQWAVARAQARAQHP